MIQIFLLLVLTVVIAYTASQNSMMVELRLLQYSVKDIPLYFIITASVGIGFFVGFIFNLVTKFTLHRAINSKKKQLEESRAHILELTRRVHQLELAVQDKTGDETDDKSL